MAADSALWPVAEECIPTIAVGGKAANVTGERFAPNHHDGLLATVSAVVSPLPKSPARLDLRTWIPNMVSDSAMHALAGSAGGIVAMIATL